MRRDVNVRVRMLQRGGQKCRLSQPSLKMVEQKNCHCCATLDAVDPVMFAVIGKHTSQHSHRLCCEYLPESHGAALSCYRPSSVFKRAQQSHLITIRHLAEGTSARGALERRSIWAETAHTWIEEWLGARLGKREAASRRQKRVALRSPTTPQTMKPARCSAAARAYSTPITSPSMSCFCVTGTSSSTTRQTRCSRTIGGSASK